MQKLINNGKNIYHFFQRLLAKYYLKLFPDIEVIGVTGSVGKTTTKEMIASVLSEKYRVLATKANIDPIYNIPLTIFKLRPGIEKLIVELSVDHFGDMDKYFFMVKPKIGVFTPIYLTHTEFLKNIDGVIKEKGRLAEVLPKNGWLILNRDDRNSNQIAKKAKAKILYYGLNQESDIYADKIKVDTLSGASFTLVDKKTKDKIFIKLNLLGVQNIYSALAAAAVGFINNLTLSQIKTGLEKIKPLPFRMNLLKLPNGSYLIDDSYNSNPLATKTAIEAVERLKTSGKKIAVLGEMKELGDLALNGHREVGKTLADHNFNVLITIGELTKYISDEASKFNHDLKIYQAQNVEQIIKILEKILKKGDIVLLKGSRFTHMERISLGLLGRKISCHKITCQLYNNCEKCKEI